MSQGHGVPLVYRAFRFFGAPFRFHVAGLENIQGSGPAIYTANHLGSLGPIQAILSVPVRFYPWVAAEMMDPARAPRYLYDDFVGPELHLDGRAGIALATVISWISVRLLKGAGAIAMDNNRGRIIDGFRRSLELLAEGQNVLIFPEDNQGQVEAGTGLYPFERGFAELCAIHQRTSGKRMPIYPMAVHAGARQIAIDSPMFIEAGTSRRQDLERACAELRQRTLSLYRQLDAPSR